MAMNLERNRKRREVENSLAVFLENVDLPRVAVTEQFQAFLVCEPFLQFLQIRLPQSAYDVLASWYTTFLFLFSFLHVLNLLG